MSDPYLKKLDRYWNEIVGIYLAHEGNKPIIEFDPNRIRIIAYPAKDYINELSDRTRNIALKQYREACEDGSIMLFVRDNQQKILRSYIFSRSDIEDI